MDDQSSGIVGAVFGGIFFLVYMAIFVLVIAGQWKLFEKAGKPGWACIVPVYSTIVMQEIVGRETWKILLLLIPIVNIYFGITLLNSYIKAYGKGGVGNLLLVLFFGYIVIPMWGFSKEVRYLGPTEEPGMSANRGYTPTTY